MSRCCGKCWHSIEYPRRNYIRCRTEGPLCHDVPSCRALRSKRIRYVKEGPEGYRIKIPLASCSIAAGAKEVLITVEEVIEDLGIPRDAVKTVGCTGLCYLDPWLELKAPSMPAALYGNVKPDEIEEILRKHFTDKDVSGAYAISERTDRAKSEGSVPTLNELDVWRLQVRYVSRNCGVVNPESIEDYVAYGGIGGLTAP